MESKAKTRYDQSIDRSIDRSPHALLASHLVSSRAAASLTGCSTTDAHIRWRSSICIRQQSRSTDQHFTTSAMCTIEDCTVARRTTHKRWSSTCVLGFRTCLRLTTMPYVFCHPAPTTKRARSASQLSCNSPQGLDAVQRSRYSSRSGQGLLRLSTSGAFGTLPPQSQPGCADLTRERCVCVLMPCSCTRSPSPHRVGCWLECIDKESPCQRRQKQHSDSMSLQTDSSAQLTRVAITRPTTIIICERARSHKPNSSNNLATRSSS